ncbi:MAG: hypothetical protein JRI23_01175 [Deltaproteobacteria bacterium]|jgi:hypothetical protein|nr:hypothetical protein [Deltaproteobacteria bacterium]MBW2530066.1 hypothetical protein [Deltaproteobacteria bacterium]
MQLSALRISYSVTRSSYTPIMSRTCPWCCEPLGLSNRKSLECPQCGRPLKDDAGRELRHLDLRYEQVAERQLHRYWQMLMVGVPVAVVVMLGLPMLHLGAVAVAPLLVLIHLLVVRLWLLAGVSRLLGAQRRRFVRWLTRLSFLWIGVLGYGLAAAPLVGLIPGVATFVGLTTLAHSYASWSLAQEWRRAPLARWERVVLWALVITTLVMLVAVAIVVALVGWSAAAIVDWLAR